MANSRKIPLRHPANAEVNCPVCHKWIETDPRGKLMQHVNWLYNHCAGGKSKRHSKIDR